MTNRLTIQVLVPLDPDALDAESVARGKPREDLIAELSERLGHELIAAARSLNGIDDRVEIDFIASEAK